MVYIIYIKVLNTSEKEPESAMGCHHVSKQRNKTKKEKEGKYKIGFVPLVTHKSSYTHKSSCNNEKACN